MKFGDKVIAQGTSRPRQGGRGGSVKKISKAEELMSEFDRNTHACWLIWFKKRGGSWYRPEANGYTINPDIAGRFTLTEAKRLCGSTHGDCIYYLETSPFVTRKRNEYLHLKRREVRGCLETMTPQQVLEIMPSLVSERIDLQKRDAI